MDSTWTIPITGVKQAIGPFPFTVRKVTIQNRCSAGNVWAVDDKGAQYEATPLTAVESKANDTVYLTVFIDAPQLLGSAAIIVSSEEPVLDVSTSQLSTQVQSGSGSNVVIPTVALASFPPAAPVDGQTVYLVVPASYNPIGGVAQRWLCTYDAANGIWHVEGEPLIAVVATQEASASTTYVDLATVGPSITLPRPGTYDITAIVDAWQSGGTVGSSFYMGYAIGGSSPVDANAAKSNGFGTNNGPVTASRTARNTGLVVANVITAKYKAPFGNGTGEYSNRVLLAKPVAIT